MRFLLLVQVDHDDLMQAPSPSDLFVHSAFAIRFTSNSILLADPTVAPEVLVVCMYTHAA